MLLVLEWLRIASGCASAIFWIWSSFVSLPEKKVRVGFAPVSPEKLKQTPRTEPFILALKWQSRLSGIAAFFAGVAALTDILLRLLPHM